jgi:hypothetical protein
VKHDQSLQCRSCLIDHTQRNELKGHRYVRWCWLRLTVHNNKPAK